VIPVPVQHQNDETSVETKIFVFAKISLQKLTKAGNFRENAKFVIFSAWYFTFLSTFCVKGIVSRKFDMLLLVPLDSFLHPFYFIRF
jgi:hypothetical protein